MKKIIENIILKLRTASHRISVLSYNAVKVQLAFFE